MKHALIVLLAAATLAASPRRQDTLLDRAAAIYTKAKTARGTFEQTMTNPLTGSTAVAHGEFFQQMPNRFAVRFSDPKGDRIVNDGKSIWVYVPSTTPGQVIKIPSGDPSASTIDPTQLLTAGFRKHLDVVELGASTVAGQSTRGYALTPKSADAPFTKATVWVNTSDATVKQFEVTDPSGLVRRVLLHKLSVNAPVNASEFSFKPPKGVKVYDQAAMMGRK